MWQRKSIKIDVPSGKADRDLVLALDDAHFVHG